jgi:cysteine desulfurase
VQRFYFDHNATTPVSAEVLDAWLPALRDVYGNASSIHHFGQVAKQQFEAARRQVAALLNAPERSIVFTSGGTEANNLAIFGVAGAGGHVVTTSIEHPAVLNPCSQMQALTKVAVGSSGVVDPADIRKALRPDTVLISVMHANNELGTLQPIAEISRIAREAGVPFHVDGVQAAGKVPVDVEALGVDLYSVSGHKFYAPKGIGALYVRQGIHLRPLLFGGRQERERRPGTENVPGAIALGRAAEIARTTLPTSDLRDQLEHAVLDRIPDAHINARGMPSMPRTPNTSNIRFDGIEGEAIVISLDLKGFAVSSGSACSSGAVEPSHVLLAIGLSPEDARSSVRFSLGKSNTAEQVDALVDALALSVAHLRRLSPAYA